MKNKIVFSAVLALMIAGSASASTLSGVDGTGNPAVPGATSTITFDGQAHQTFGSTTIGGVTFSGTTAALRIANTYAGSYNTRGREYLDNVSGNANVFRFDFATPISAFAFNFGASDSVWQLSAFNATNNLIESMLISATRGSNAGDYFGLQDAGMAYATLTNLGGSDYVFVDNFTIAADAGTSVPEPASAALLAMGLLGFAAARRKSSQ